MGFLLLPKRDKPLDWYFRTISNQPVSHTCSLVVDPQWSLLVLSGSSWLKWREPCRPWHQPQLSSHRHREWSLRPKPATTCWMKTSGVQGASQTEICKRTLVSFNHYLLHIFPQVPCDLKQNATQDITPFSGFVLNALSHGGISFSSNS